MNKKVWVVQGGWNYEGLVIIGIFDSKSKANGCLEKSKTDKDFRYDEVIVTQFEVR
jgi:hypothetical protein